MQHLWLEGFYSLEAFNAAGSTGTFAVDSLVSSRLMPFSSATRIE